VALDKKKRHAIGQRWRLAVAGGGWQWGVQGAVGKRALFKY